MQRPHPIAPILLCACACATLAAVAACEQRVHLGEIGDGGASLLWSATFEPGDLSEWMSDGHGGAHVGNAAVVATASPDLAHRGQYAGIVQVTPAPGLPALSYLFRNQPSPRQAYYSAWFYIPPSLVVRGWLSLHHFQYSPSNDGKNLFALWDLNLYPRPDGTLVAHLYNYGTLVNLEQPVPIPVPIGTWVHFEVLLRKAADATGEVAVWQDGVLILEQRGVATAPTDWVEWDAGASSDSVDPPTATVYIDDAAISLSRRGTIQ